MTYVFFDIDGVLNKRAEWIRSYSMNPKCIQNFCKFAKSVDGILIMASSWRRGFLRSGSIHNSLPVRQLEEYFSAYGITIAGKTGIDVGRDEEIRLFIKEHSVKKYVIVDDDPYEYKKILPHTYFTDAAAGFTEKDIRRCRQCIS